MEDHKTSESVCFMEIDENTVVKAKLEKTIKITTLVGVEELINIYNFDSGDGRKMYGVFNSDNNLGLHFGTLKMRTLIRELENRGIQIIEWNNGFVGLLYSK